MYARGQSSRVPAYSRPTTDASLGDETNKHSGRLHERVARDRVIARMLGAADGRSSQRPATVDRYLLEQPLGSGGNGIVYAGHDPKLNRPVAIKLLGSAGCKDPAGTDRLLREARALARVEHPHIVSVYDVGKTEEEDGVFIVMERLAGPTLAQWHDSPQARRAGGWRLAIELYLQAGRGLVAAHAAGLVHRDFKPANVMRDASGRVKVLDFGLVWHTRSDDGSIPTDPVSAEYGAATSSGAGAGTTDGDRLTQTGATMGTPVYMAPEQHLGKPATVASDQFSFCAAVYEAVFGLHPFPGADAAEIATAKLTGVMTPIPEERRVEVPREVGDILMRGLAARPSARWPTMDALLEALRVTVQPPPKRARWAVAAAATVVAVGTAMVLAEPDPACGQARPPWNEDVRDASQASFSRATVPGAGTVWTRVDAAARSWSDEWTEARAEVCSAHRRGEVDDATFDRIIGCLRRRADRFSDVAETMSTPGARVMAEAVGLVVAQARPGTCRDLTQVDQLEPRPDDRAQAAQVDKLRQREQALFDAMVLGRIAEVEPEIEALVDDAEALGYGPFVAEAHALAARALAESGAYEEADQRWQKAIALAQEEDHDFLVARNMSVLMFNTGVYRERVPEALLQLPWAYAMVQRAGNPVIPLAGLEQAAGHLHMRAGDLDEASAAFQRARDHFSSVQPPHQAGIADADQGLGLIARSQGDRTEAMRLCRDAFERMEAAQGELSPNAAMMRQEYGFLLMQEGRIEESEAQHRLATQRVETIKGSDHPDMIQMLHGLASVQRRSDPETAAVTAARALALSDTVHGGDHEQTGWLKNLMALIESDRGNVDAGLRHADEARGVFERIRGERSYEVATVLGARSMILTAAGRREEARSALETVVEIGRELDRLDLVRHAEEDLAAL